MLTSHAFLFFMLLLLVAGLLEPIIQKIHLPFSILLVVIGFVGSELIVQIFGADTGLRWDNFGPIVFYVILPLLIFKAALETDLRLLWQNTLLILLLSIPLMIASAFITAAGVYYGIGHSTGFPWIAALLTGALLSATDPAAILSFFPKTTVTTKLRLLLEGESLLNDATAVVLFSILIMVASGDLQHASWDTAILRFMTVFFGGLSTGIVIGGIAYWIIKLSDRKELFVLFSIICAYASFIVSENFLNFSGVMAVLSSGLMMSPLYKSYTYSGSNKFPKQFWGFLSYIGESLIFILAGVTITLSMFSDQWIAILIGIATVLIARSLVIFGLCPIFSYLPGVQAVPAKQQVVLVWGGARGVVTLALALSLPLSLKYWYTIQAIAYGVVLFALFVQATTMETLIKKLNFHN